ncbi:MAG: hypothetical protein ABIG11_01040 [bacterium]
MTLNKGFQKFLVSELGKNGVAKFKTMTPEWQAHYRRMYGLSKIRWARPVSLSESILELRYPHAAFPS